MIQNTRIKVECPKCGEVFWIDLTDLEFEKYEV